ncbi:MAG: IclR family transcriptional regulator [Turicibacter sp.]|nr:IclR family transcriptional regulator [Turicibacter sp.]
MKINRTVERAVEILELIASTDRELTLSDIAKELEMPKTSTFDILETLVHSNMLYTKENGIKTYKIGVKAYSIGSNYSRTSLLLNASEPIIKELAQATGLTILIAKETSGEIVFTLKQEPEKKTIATPSIGDRLHIHTTSIGKSILAFSHKQERLFEQIDFCAQTNMSITSKSDLVKEVEKIKAQGYSISNRENETYTFSIGAPIFDHRGYVTAAIGTLGLYEESYDPTRDIELVKVAAMRISKLQGYKG